MPLTQIKQYMSSTQQHELINSHISEQEDNRLISRNRSLIFSSPLKNQDQYHHQFHQLNKAASYSSENFTNQSNMKFYRSQASFSTFSEQLSSKGLSFNNGLPCHQALILNQMFLFQKRDQFVFNSDENQENYTPHDKYEKYIRINDQLVVVKQNMQSSQFVINQEAKSSQEYFQDLNKTLRKQNFLAMKPIWDCELKQRLEEIEKNWSLFEHILQTEISMFTRLNFYKMYKLNSAINYKNPNNKLRVNYYEHIYPKMSHFLIFFSKKFGFKSIEDYSNDLKFSKDQGKLINSQQGGSLLNNEQSEEIEKKVESLRIELQIQQNRSDQLLYEVLREERSKSEINKGQNIRIKSMELQEYVSNCQDFSKGSSWGNLLASIPQLAYKVNKGFQYFQNIENERLMQSRCLGCSKFFINDQTIYDQNVTHSPVKFFPSIRKLKEIQARLKDEICGLLNSGGGIILFNCYRKYKSVYAEGDCMNEKDKQQYQQRIYSYSDQFYPKIQIKNHIVVKFVPIISLENKIQGNMKRYMGEEGISKENHSFINRNFCKGQYVTRITVTPADASLVYFWYIPSKPVNETPMRSFCQIDNADGTSVKLRNKQMIRLIKKKMIQFYFKEAYSEKEKRLLKNPFCYMDHDCSEPDSGAAIAQSKNFIPQRSIKVPNLEDQYKYLTLVVAKVEFHNKIKQNFRKKHLNFQMIVPFQDKGFRGAQNTAALYHNNKFQQFFYEVNNNPNYFFDRQVLVISVTSYLKLEMSNQHVRLTQQYFDKIGSMFAETYPNQTLKAYEFKNINTKRSDFFLLTQSKISNLFLYYLLNQHKQIGKAIFKNPYLLDKLSPKEREQRFVLIFQRKGRNELILNYGERRNQSCEFSLQSNQQTMVESYNDLQVEQNEKQKRQEKTANCSELLIDGQLVDQKEVFLFENWFQVIQEYDYLIGGEHKSQISKIYEILYQ